MKVRMIRTGQAVGDASLYLYNALCSPTKTEIISPRKYKFETIIFF
jgi:hypothetical protein